MIVRGLLLFTLCSIACGSVHPITEAPYINLEQGVDGVRLADFPTAIIDSLAWNDLASASLRSVNEEFHIAIKSESKPYQLFRISNDRKDPGETILYWPKPVVKTGLVPEENMHDYLQGLCKDFLEAGDFEYCIPRFSRSANWKTTFENLVNRNIWSMQDGAIFEEGEEEINSDWAMIFQIRAGMNYRTFQHNNPDGYIRTEEALNLMAIVTQLSQIADNFTPVDNYNIFEGITTGVRGSEFAPCGSNETWRFNGELSELTNNNGVPITVTDQENIRFLVKLEGTIRDEWYSQRNSTGFSKVISPVHINSLTVTSATRCNN